ncbi:flagellar hook-length control protein FliK [Gammaproteobacteria bacterium]|nr:flagellar hook-length control protein FliK [Gammaproteobacteria bacterium]
MSDYTTPSSILAITGSGKIGNQSAYRNDSNEAFLGEKFEFSSVLRSKVDSVEKTYSDAQNPKKPIDTSLPVSSTSSDQDAFNKSIDDEIVPTKTSDLENSNNPKNEANYDKASSNIANNDHADSSSEGKNLSLSENNNQVIKSKEQNAGEVFGENQVDLEINENINTTLSNKQNSNIVEKYVTTQAAPMDKVQVQTNSNTAPTSPIIIAADKAGENSAKNSAQTANGGEKVAARMSGEALSSATLTKTNPEVSEDINKIVLKNIKEAPVLQNAASANNSNTTKQEQDLSNRLKNNPTSHVKVSVDNNGDKSNTQVAQANTTQLNAAPNHTKAPTAQFAELSLEESQAAVSKATNGRHSINGDAKTSNNHSITTNSNTASIGQQANTINQTQMMRQQSAAIGAQQSAANQSTMAPKAGMTIEIPGIGGAAAGPNNTTQQVNKVAPPPPPPPPKPPAPVEQVAVQIKKAIGEGADKINIKLQPANLGKVEVRMEIGKDGILTASVIAEKPETLELLQRDVRGLEKVLQEGGLRTDNQSFNFSLKEHAQQQAANGRDKTNEQTSNDEQVLDETEVDDAETPASEAPIYGQNIATNGGVNIMI